MNARPFIAALSVLALAGPPSVCVGPAWACECEEPGPLEEELANYEMVFIGEVTHSSISLGCGGGDQTTHLDVTEAFKGVTVGEEVKIKHPAGGPTCGGEMEDGESWLIFANSNYYDTCHPGGLLEWFTDEEIDAFRNAASAQR